MKSGVFSAEELEARIAGDRRGRGRRRRAQNDAIAGGLRDLIYHGAPVEPRTSTRRRPSPSATACAAACSRAPATRASRSTPRASAASSSRCIPRLPEPDTSRRGEGEHPEHVYSVRFAGRELWPDGDERSAVVVDLWESYLEPADRRSSMSTEHDGANRYAALRTRAIESLLIEKGLLSEEAVDVVVEAYGSDIGPLHGARVVARAWIDPAFKERLLEDATAAARELGVGGFVAEYVRAVENTDDAAQPRRVHALLVLPVGPARPAARLVQVARVPRRARCASRAPCCASSASSSPRTTEIRIWDSSSDLRYIVIPQRPDGTDDLAEDELAALVTRESMIGTGLARAPASHEQRRRSCRSPRSEGLPRRNGELVFEAPGRPRVRRRRGAVRAAGASSWEAFRSRLIDEIGAWEREHGADTSDWELLRALARLARAPACSSASSWTSAEVEARVARIAHADAHDHDHEHDHDHDHDHD